MITRSRKTILVGSLLSLSVLTGCSSMSAEPDEAGLQYGGGPIESKTFADCAETGSREWGGIFDTFYGYPAGERTYDFSDNPEAESVPIKFRSKDPVEMNVSGLLKFRMNTDCKVLQKFHETIGRKYQAYNVDGNSSEGWERLLDNYIGLPLQRALQLAAQDFAWEEMYNNPARRADFEKRVAELLPEFVAKEAGDQPFFMDPVLTLNQPQPPQELIDQFKNRQINDQALTTINERQATLDAERAQIDQLIQTLGVEGYIQYRVLENCSDGKQETECIPFPINGSDVAVAPR